MLYAIYVYIPATGIRGEECCKIQSERGLSQTPIKPCYWRFSTEPLLSSAKPTAAYCMGFTALHSPTNAKYSPIKPEN